MTGSIIRIRPFSPRTRGRAECGGRRKNAAPRRIVVVCDGIALLAGIVRRPDAAVPEPGTPPTIFLETWAGLP